MIIQTIGLDPAGSVWTDSTSNVSRSDPSRADQIDANHPTRNRKVVGSNRPRAPPTSRSADDAAHQRNELLRVADDPPVAPGQLDEVGPGPLGQPGRRGPVPGVAVLRAYRHG